MRKKTLYGRIRQILESARTEVARTVNTAQVLANWMIGREIVENEQKGRKRADYGHQLLTYISTRLEKEFGNGYSVDNLEFFRRFYRTYRGLISDALRRKSIRVTGEGRMKRPTTMNELKIFRDPKGHSWRPGCFHSSLSWTHYRTLLRVSKEEARAFYEIETIKNSWSSRELERQINSLLYERLALSRDKKGLLRLATKGHMVRCPQDVFKDPVVMEFLGLPTSPKLVESELEQGLINNLQTFLLEMGKGFAFIAQQERITLAGDHFYIDLVFYHSILKCYMLIEIKVGKLTHQDLGQLQLYVNYYDQERRTKTDNPTLGMILCTDKNDAVVRYTLGPDQQKKIFASRYKLHLPTEMELKAEVQRGLDQLRSAPKRKKNK